jgi:hypothetical protein
MPVRTDDDLLDVSVGEDGQFVTAPVAAALQDIAAILGLHPQAKAVYAQAAAVLRLKSSLHICSLVYTWSDYYRIGASYSLRHAQCAEHQTAR